MNALNTNRINVNAIIVPRTHPQMKVIIELFDEEVAMFQANKPQDI